MLVRLKLLGVPSDAMAVKTGLEVDEIEAR